MKHISKFIFCLCLSIFTASGAFASDYEIKDFGIDKLSLPDEFIACTRAACDSELAELLASNKFSHSSWVEQVMKPNDFYIYATTADGTKTFYAVCKKGQTEEVVENEDGTKTHRLMKDYNLIKTADEKDDFIKSLKENMIFQGIDQDSISKLGWAETADSKTKYTEYICKAGNEYFHCYETVYDANTIEFQFASQKSFTNDELSYHDDFIKNISYAKLVDYSEAERLTNENLQKKLAEETHSGENTKILRYAISISIAIVIIMAVYMAIKSQSSKRKRRLVLREAEQDEENTR